MKVETAFVSGQINNPRNASVVGVTLHKTLPLTQTQQHEVVQALAQKIRRIDTLITIEFVKNSVLICIKLLGVLADKSLKRAMKQVKQVLEKLGLVETAWICSPFPPVR